MDRVRASTLCGCRRAAGSPFSTWDNAGCGSAGVFGEPVSWRLGGGGTVLSGGGDEARNEDDRRGILGDVTVVFVSGVCKGSVCWVNGGTAEISGSLRSAGSAGIWKGAGVGSWRAWDKGTSGAFEVSMGSIFECGFREEVVDRFCQTNRRVFDEVEGNGVCELVGCDGCGPKKDDFPKMEPACCGAGEGFVVTGAGDEADEAVL